MRTQEEILARMKAGDSVFGWNSEVLLCALKYDVAKPLLDPGSTFTQEKWDERALFTDEAIKREALEYLQFAWGKAEDHRGLSASRSVEKMTEFCWLLGLDIQKIEDAGYTNYGAPKLKVVAELLGAPVPTDQALVNMMDGKPCQDGCEMGCGQ